MATRTLPEPDLYAVCPNEGPVLSFYQGVFEAVYVLLYPFIRPTAMSSERVRTDDSIDRAAIVATCEPVTWAEVQRLTSFHSLAEIDVALRTQIAGLRDEFANQALATRMRKSVEQAGLVEPSEGRFSDLSYNKVLSFIQELGYEWVWIGDEHCTERKLRWIEDLKDPSSNATQRNCNVFTPDKSLLWTTHWDSHFSFFCSSKDIITRLAAYEELEGFECSADTEVYWSVRGDA